MVRMVKGDVGMRLEVWRAAALMEQELCKAQRCWQEAVHGVEAQTQLTITQPPQLSIPNPKLGVRTFTRGLSRSLSLTLALTPIWKLVTPQRSQPTLIATLT